jgi:phosphohistidine phosphatase
MHVLHLLRHAKSSWKEEVGDRERRLNRRGRESARRVGRHLQGAVGALDLVICSSAARTRETMDLILAELPVRPRSLLEDELYAASQEKLMNRLRRLAEDDVNVLVIGHNPGIHELATTLADPNSPRFRMLAASKFPTAARATLRVSDPWSALGRSRYEIVDYVTADSLSSGKG